LTGEAEVQEAGLAAEVEVVEVDAMEDVVVAEERLVMKTVRCLTQKSHIAITRPLNGAS